MLAIYLAALVFGLGGVLVQVFGSSGQGEADGDALPGFSAGGGGELTAGELAHGELAHGELASGELAPDAALGGDLDHGDLAHGGGDYGAAPGAELGRGGAALAPAQAPPTGGLGAPGEAAGHGVSALGEWLSAVLSLRFYLFFSLGFGLVGAPATFLAVASPVLVGGFAAAIGLVSGFGASSAVRWLGRHPAGADLPATLVGRVGRVLLPCAEGRRGKVRLSLPGEIVDYLASTADGEPLEVGALVVVQEVDPAGVLQVCRVPADLSQ